jgi:hypothetical protein
VGFLVFKFVVVEFNDKYCLKELLSIRVEKLGRTVLCEEKLC